MWDFGRIPKNPPLEQRTIEPPLKWLSICPLSTNQDSLLQCIGSTRLTWKHHLPRELALTELIHGSHQDITRAHHLRSAFQGFIHLANFKLGSDTTCKDSMDTTYLHNGMILSTLGLSPHGFAFRLTPKGLIPMEIFVHPYIPMILPTSSQCGILVVYPTTWVSSIFWPQPCPSNSQILGESTIDGPSVMNLLCCKYLIYIPVDELSQRLTFSRVSHPF